MGRERPERQEALLPSEAVGRFRRHHQVLEKRGQPFPRLSRSALLCSAPPVAAFVWFGLLRLWRKRAVLCADPQRSRVYVEPVQESCRQRAFWGLQLDGRLRNVADPASCLLVSFPGAPDAPPPPACEGGLAGQDGPRADCPPACAVQVSPDGTALSSGPDCSADARSSFRLLPDQRLQSLSSGFCLFQEAVSTRLYLATCTPQASRFVLDRGGSKELRAASSRRLTWERGRAQVSFLAGGGA